jgi:hypothetical protein
MLEVLVGQRFHDQRRPELAALDQLRRLRRRDDRVVALTRDALVESTPHDQLSRSHVQDLAHGVADRRRGLAAQRTLAQVRRDVIDLGNTLQVRRQR